MPSQQSDQNQKGKKTTSSKPSMPDKPPGQPKRSNPMDTFNTAMRKILSVSKKDLKQKQNCSGTRISNVCRVLLISQVCQYHVRRIDECAVLYCILFIRLPQGRSSLRFQGQSLDRLFYYLIYNVAISQLCLYCISESLRFLVIIDESFVWLLGGKELKNLSRSNP